MMNDDDDEVESSCTFCTGFCGVANMQSYSWRIVVHIPNDDPQWDVFFGHGSVSVLGFSRKL